jgi:hypothetical protein
VDGWFGDYIIREARDDSPLSIRLLGKRLENWDRDAKYEKHNGAIDMTRRFFAIFSIDGFSENDWQLLDRYFSPGDFWK